MNKKLLATAIAGAMVFPTVASALDTKISGRVNRMIRFADNGEDSAVQFLEGSQASSRFRFNTSGDIGGGVTAGIIYEAGFLQSSRSSAVGLGKNPEDGPGAGDNEINLRHAAVYFKGNFGRVDVGQTTEATDGIAYADLSGTGLGDEVAAGYADAVEFQDDDNVLGTVSNSVATTGGGRLDLIKYETPNLGGFGVIRASMANNSQWGIGAFLGGAAGGGEWQLNIGYGDKGGNSAGANDSDDEFYGGSAAFLFGQGTNIAVSYTVSEPEGDDTETEDFYVKLGHKWGNNAASVSYGHSEFDDNAGPFEEGDRFSLAYVHTLPNSGINLYGGYHLYMADSQNGDDPDDINVLHVGALINFN